MGAAGVPFWEASAPSRVSLSRHHPKHFTSKVPFRPHEQPREGEDFIPNLQMKKLRPRDQKHWGLATALSHPCSVSFHSQAV